jgi:hypothetical protein
MYRKFFYRNQILHNSYTNPLNQKSPENCNCRRCALQLRKKTISIASKFARTNAYTLAADAVLLMQIKTFLFLHRIRCPCPEWVVKSSGQYVASDRDKPYSTTLRTEYFYSVDRGVVLQRTESCKQTARRRPAAMQHI